MIPVIQRYKVQWLIIIDFFLKILFLNKHTRIKQKQKNNFIYLNFDPIGFLFVFDVLKYER